MHRHATNYSFCNYISNSNIVKVGRSPPTTSKFSVWQVFDVVDDFHHFPKKKQPLSPNQKYEKFWI